MDQSPSQTCNPETHPALAKNFGVDWFRYRAASEPSNCHVTQNLTAAGGALALLLPVCAAVDVRGLDRGVRRVSPRPLLRRDRGRVADAETVERAPSRRAVKRRHTAPVGTIFSPWRLSFVLNSTCCCSSQSTVSRAPFQTSAGRAVEVAVHPAG